MLRAKFMGCQVTATGASAIRVPAVQPSAAGARFLRPMAEKPIPEQPTPVAATRHPEDFLPPPLPLPLSFTFALPLLLSLRATGQLGL